MWMFECLYLMKLLCSLICHFFWPVGRDEELFCYVIHSRAFHCRCYYNHHGKWQRLGESRREHLLAMLLKTVNFFFSHDAFLSTENRMGEEGHTFTNRLIIHWAKIFILRILLATVRRTASGLSFLSVELRLFFSWKVIASDPPHYPCVG